MGNSNYIPKFAPGDRVVLTGHDRHPKNGQHCTILSTLPNPSQRFESQWFDVRFDDYSVGRFIEKHLELPREEIKGDSVLGVRTET
jgi:hypothetical protein